MKKKQLDKEHVFLQFLMMFLTLSSFLLFPLLSKEVPNIFNFPILFSESIQITLSIPIILICFLSLLYFILSKKWLYYDIYFWIIFSSALLIFSRLFFLYFSLTNTLFWLQYSRLLIVFTCIAICIGGGNEIYNLIKKKDNFKKK